jgi:hypothetical protein
MSTDPQSPHHAVASVKRITVIARKKDEVVWERAEGVCACAGSTSGIAWN